MEATLPEIIGIIRDVVFIVSLLFVCFVIYRTARKINNVVDSAKRTGKKIETIIEFIAVENVMTLTNSINKKEA